MSKFTPNEIEVLIHCYARPCVHPRFDAPAVNAAFHNFAHDGLIQRDNRSPDCPVFITTDAGDALMNQFMAAHALYEACQEAAADWPHMTMQTYDLLKSALALVDGK